MFEVRQAWLWGLTSEAFVIQLLHQTCSLERLNLHRPVWSWSSLLLFSSICTILLEPLNHWTMLNLQTRPKIPPGVCNSRWHSAVDEGGLRATYGQGTWQRHVPGFQPWCDNVWHHFRVISSKAGFSSTEIDSLEESLKARGKLQRAIGWWHRERERERERKRERVLHECGWLMLFVSSTDFNITLWLPTRRCSVTMTKTAVATLTPSRQEKRLCTDGRSTHTHVGVSSTNFEIPPSCFHRFFV